ncbi:hypothetical protein JW916_11975 [Candidatus Sumerlaeota bacterium]|nr:hypothetical protein [Candidatus Sumerlaeota bacterium]
MRVFAPRTPFVLEAAIVSVVAGYATLLIGFPRAFEHWFLAMHYPYQNRNPFALFMVPWFVPLAASFALLAWIVARLWRTRYAALLLFLTGISLQWSFSFLDHGVNAWRLSSTLIERHYGHSEFPILAFYEEHPLQMARRYEELCASTDGPSFTKSKPPGQMLFYVLWARAYHVLRLEKVFERLSGPLSFRPREPFTAYGAFMTIAFSVFSNLPVFALWEIGRLVRRKRVGLYCCVAFLLCPSIELVTMHMDQVLYPLLASVTILFSLLAVRRNKYYALVAASVLYAAVYTSFSLLFLVPTILLWAGATILLRKDRRARILSALAVGVVGLAVSHFLFAAFLNFDPFAAYRRAMANHIAWRKTPGLVGPLLTVRNLWELAIWVGWPTAVVYVWGCCRIARRLGRSRKISPADLFVLLYPVLLVAISTFGHTVAEIGRLWIPLMVPLFVAAALELDTRDRHRAPWVYLVSSLFMVLLAKYFHDFW